MESRTSIHTSAVKMTSIKIGIKLDLKLITIFWKYNQKLVSHVWEGLQRFGSPAVNDYVGTIFYKT